MEKTALSVKEIFGWSYDNHYTPRIEGKSPRVIIIGETHQNNNQIAKQEQLIDLVKPKVILHEMAGGAICTYESNENQIVYNARSGSGYIQQDINSGLSAPYPYMLEWVKKKELTLVGIGMYGLPLERRARQKYPGRKFTQEELMPTSDVMCRILEEWMGKSVIEYWPDKGEQLMVIAGSHHTRPESEIHKVLARDNPKLVEKLKQNPEYGYICLTPR